MIDFIKDLANSLDDLYHYLIYLIENHSNSVPIQEWNIRCNGMFNITQGRCEVSYIDRSQNIPSISVSNNINNNGNNNNNNNHNNNSQILQNNITEEDVLFGFVTIILIWFIIAIIIILCTIIISLIITNINSSYSSEERDKDIKTIANCDLEKQSLQLTIPEI